ncbi:MAG: alpha/beta hydrolase [Altibacter sp.]|uniref:alpha/beta fold hydrolase n=1 Tax=Altibacter sp. TaxID=2024823 RepID=UPI001E046CA7|nr:alpha/beta hydrolase [Altibacter sp.]MBZ0327049.1 alpha/beta hydrolase [Altibacter sp.]
MTSEKIHVYFVPGMAAGAEIFRNIRLPEDRFTIHILQWLIPEKNESITTYSERMATLITEKESVLIGVSFGGVVAQEMSEFLSLRKLIIISSVKTKDELPRRMKFARKSFFYKLIPTSLVLSAEDLTKFSVGPRSEKRLRLYQDYLHVRDKQYLDWAIQNMVCWNRKTPVAHVTHIHGDSDIVFPLKHIKDCEVLEGGTHIMILTKGLQLSEMIVAIIEKN